MRKVFFWLHLIAGTTGGVVILIMSVTGVLLMYEKQILAWADTRATRIDAPTPGASRPPMEELVAKVRDQRQALPTTIAMRNEANAPLMLAYGREGAVFVNPYTGRIVGQGAQGVRDFFRVVTDWHRWLGAPVENRVGGEGDYGRVQPGVSVPGDERLLHLVSAEVDVAARSPGDLVQAWTARQSARLQLAQRDRCVVRRAAIFRSAGSDRHLVSVGEQFRLPDRGQ